MNKKLIWGIIIAIIVVAGLILIFGGDDTDSQDSGGITITDQNTNDESQNSVDLQTSDDVFNELDSTLEYVE